MSQKLLAKLMGVSLQEVDRRIQALFDFCDKNGLPRPIVILRSPNGVVQYRLVPSQKKALARAFASN